MPSKAVQAVVRAFCFVLADAVSLSLRHAWCGLCNGRCRHDCRSCLSRLRSRLRSRDALRLVSCRRPRFWLRPNLHTRFKREADHIPREDSKPLQHTTILMMPSTSPGTLFVLSSTNSSRNQKGRRWTPGATSNPQSSGRTLCACPWRRNPRRREGSRGK